MRHPAQLIRNIVAIAAILLPAAVLPARPFDLPPGKWWELPRLIEYIRLSHEQQQRISELVYQHAERLIDLNAGVERCKLNLERLVEQDDFDADAVRKAFRAFQSARQMLESERFEMLLAVRQVVSTEQWRRLAGLRERLEQGRERRRQPGDGPPDRRPGDAAPHPDGFPRRAN